ncbi:MAG: hypothetical protein JWQ04_1866 [Pedosphaera sp.]|nr:hypothetical protein [Pedosphaera sp.]
MQPSGNAQPQFLSDDLLLEVGRIAVRRGSLRFMLLSIADALFSARLGGWGAGRVLLANRELPEICEALVTISEAGGVPSDAVLNLADIAEKYRADFEFAAAIANGIWTYLGGEDDRQYGLYEREVVSDCQLTPQWRRVRIADLRKLRQRLDNAAEALRPLPLAMMSARRSE